MRMWAVLAASLAAAPAWAQHDDVEALLRRGVALRREGRDEAAFAAFESAWTLAHEPRARAQMGLAAQALGRWTLADTFLREALAASDAWVTERRAVLTRSLDEVDAHLGSLEVRCNVDGAEVRVDGELVGTTPLPGPLRRPAGTVAVQLRAQGHVDAVRQAVVTLGGSTREQVDLVAVAPTPTTPPATPPPVARANPVVTPPPRVVTPPHPPPHPSPAGAPVRRALAWTSAGVALAGVALGAVFLGLRNDSAEAFNARNRNGDPSDDCTRGSSVSSCREAESTVSTQESVSLAGFVVGGAAAVGAAVLFATMPSTRREGAVGAWRGCAVTPDRQGFGAACAVDF